MHSAPFSRVPNEYSCSLLGRFPLPSYYSCSFGCLSLTACSIACWMQSVKRGRGEFQGNCSTHNPGTRSRYLLSQPGRLCFTRILPLLDSWRPRFKAICRTIAVRTVVVRRLHYSLRPASRSFATRRSLSARASTRTGLPRYSSIPTSRHHWRSLSIACAVIAIM